MNKKGIEPATTAVIVIVVAAVVAGLTVFSNNDLQLAPAGESEVSLREMSLGVFEDIYEYGEAKPREKQEVLKQIIDTGEKRKEALITSIEENPEEILRYYVPLELLKNLPGDIQREYFEEKVVLSGELTIIHTDNFETGVSEEFYYIDMESERLRLHFADERSKPRSLSGTLITVDGIRIEGSVVVSVVEESEYTPPVSLTGKKIAVILYNFQDLPTEPYTIEFMEGAIFKNRGSVENYYEEVSFGKLGLSGDVLGWYTIPFGNDFECDQLDEMAELVRIEAENDGVNLDNYDFFIYSSNTNGDCALAGLGEIGGENAWLLWDGHEQDLYTLVAAHELGHVLGHTHSNAYNCFDDDNQETQISNNCNQIEYGDVFDLMGIISFGHMNNFNKGFASWLTEANTFDVTKDGTYTIMPIEFVPKDFAVSQVQSLRIPLGFTDLPVAKPAYFYLEYRRPFGFDDFDLEDPVVNGVTVRFGAEYDENSHSFLLDTTPGSHYPDWTEDFLDSPLTLGNIFEDSFRGVIVETTSTSPNRATVDISFYQPECVRADPDVSITPYSQEGYPGDTVKYTMRLTNFDNPGCPDSTYIVNWNLAGGDDDPPPPEGWSQAPRSPIIVKLAPAESVEMEIAITSPIDAQPDYYEFEEKAINIDHPEYYDSESFAYFVL